MIRTFLVTALLVTALTAHAHASEVYLLNGNPVLLYKIINWWYDCPPEDAYNYCGNPITCRNEGDTTVRYDAGKKTLDLIITGGFADLLSVFKPCKKCHGPAYMTCTYLNQSYFGAAHAEDVLNDEKGLSSFLIKDVDTPYIDRIHRIEKNISFELRGEIHGLANGKISLHASEDLLKICPEKEEDALEDDPITLHIIDSSSDQILATYSAVWTDS